MGASILLLSAATGTMQEAYLTQNPEINVFKSVYSRYVNFAVETINIPLSSDAAFGTSTTVTVPRKGHLLSKMYLQITLPQLTNVDGTYACWCDTIGYAIFKESIDLLIGGVVVDRLYPICMDIQDELNTVDKKSKNSLILKSDIYRSTVYNATEQVVLKIPLDFWFTRDYTMALPVFLMSQQGIQLNFTFESFANLINFDGTIGVSGTKNIIESKLLLEYIFLDDIILDSYTSTPQRYAIEQQVYNGKQPIDAGTLFKNVRLDFDNSCKELLFACVSNDNDATNNYFNYSIPNTTGNNYYNGVNQSPGTISAFIDEVSLMLNGGHFFEDYLPEYVFRELKARDTHYSASNKHIYVFPFCINGSVVTQPSGSINMSRFDDVIFSLKFKHGIPACHLHLFSIAYNIVNISNGILSFAFNNS